jgi:hypothetical protein
LDAKRVLIYFFSLMNIIGAHLSPLLVMHESRLQMQVCASQIDKKHYNMLKMRHRQAR